MAAPLPTPPPADRGISERPGTERRPDCGNVIHVGCRRCGTSNVLDLTRMEARNSRRVVLTCIWCKEQLSVRRRDVGHPAPDAEIASLSTAPAAKAPSRWKRLSHRS